MDKKTFKATFTLTQEVGEDGESELYSALRFEPLVDVAAGEDGPEAYEIMSHLVQQYLYMVGVVDEDGELIDPEGFHDFNVLDVRGFGDKLN